MQSKNKHDMIMFTFRLLLAIFSWIVLVMMFYQNVISQSNISSGILAAIGSYKYYSRQTNLLVALWYSFALIFHFKPIYLKKIQGVLKGAITVYITITFVVFAVMLSDLYHPTGIDSFLSVCSHYLIPIMFVVDWFISETDNNYEWRYLVYWIIYLLLYLIFTIVYAYFTNNYLYPFLNIQNLGWGKFTLNVGLLIAVSLFFGSLFISANKIIRYTIEKRSLSKDNVNFINFGSNKKSRIPTSTEYYDSFCIVISS